LETLGLARRERGQSPDLGRRRGQKLLAVEETHLLRPNPEE
jgi:hypothetical protein